MVQCLELPPSSWPTEAHLNLKKPEHCSVKIRVGNRIENHVSFGERKTVLMKLFQYLFPPLFLYNNDNNVVNCYNQNNSNGKSHLKDNENEN